jgi:hypothetical protein
VNPCHPSPGGFRQALEARLRAEAAKRGVPLNDLRQKLVMERLLARLFAEPNPPWLLKGGYAMELRYRPHARTTRDLDLTALGSKPDLASRLSELRQQLQDAADTDAGDYLVFRIGIPKGELPGPPLGGSRFPVVALLAGKEYARFHVDAGFGDPVIGEPEALVGEDFFAFAGLPPARAGAIPKAQQFAEKIHAYTYPWTDRENTRVKDLVDLVILIERGDLDPERVWAAAQATFSTRATHPAPTALPDAPSAWTNGFASLAMEAGLDVRDVGRAAEQVRRFWTTVIAIDG